MKFPKLSLLWKILLSTSIALTVLFISLFNEMCRKPTAAQGESLAGQAQHEVEDKIHMDLTSDTDHLPVRTVITRAARFFGYLLAFMACMAVIGLIPTVPIFVIAFMRFEGPEPWRLVIPQAVFITLFVYVMFDQMLTIPWPPTVLGDFFPQLLPLAARIGEVLGHTAEEPKRSLAASGDQQTGRGDKGQEAAHGFIPIGNGDTARLPHSAIFGRALERFRTVG